MGLLVSCDTDGAGDESPDQQAIEASDVLPDHFPEDFPVPEQVVPAGRGDAAGFAVEDDPEAVLTSYRRALEDGGWELGEDWEGLDPQGRETAGLIFFRDGWNGALAVSEGEEYPSVVRITLTPDEDDEDDDDPEPPGGAGDGAEPGGPAG